MPMVYLPVLCDLQWYWFLLLFECVCLSLFAAESAVPQRGSDRQRADSRWQTPHTAVCPETWEPPGLRSITSQIALRLRRSQIPQIPPTPAAVRTTWKKHETRISSIAGRSATGRLNAAQPVLHGVQWAHTVITNESSDISALQKVAEIMCYSEAAVLLMWSACFSGEPHGQQLRGTLSHVVRGHGISPQAVRQLLCPHKDGLFVTAKLRRRSEKHRAKERENEIERQRPHMHWLFSIL